MRPIIWQSKSEIVYQSILANKLLSGANGGNAYDVQTALTLSERYSIHASSESVKKKNESLINYWFRSKFISDKNSLIIREPYPIVFGKYNRSNKFIGVIHHIDHDLSWSSLKHYYYFKMLWKNLKKLDAIVTVSNYWKKELEMAGLKNIHVIYNSYPVEKYTISQASISTFKKRFNINPNKPLIYIGNASREKGVYEVYEALRSKNYELIMSGSSNNAADLPVQYYNFNAADFQQMLAASDVVLCMSSMIEGWNRIAHESLLCGTPVIGSGSGGMTELLQCSQQIILKDPALLDDKIQFLLANRSEFSNNGRKFVEQFDMNYFTNKWFTLINNMDS